jgi:hypothetical protein
LERVYKDNGDEDKEEQQDEDEEEDIIHVDLRGSSNITSTTSQQQQPITLEELFKLLTFDWIDCFSNVLHKFKLDLNAISDEQVYIPTTRSTESIGSNLQRALDHHSSTNSELLRAVVRLRQTSHSTSGLVDRWDALAMYVGNKRNDIRTKQKEMVEEVFKKQQKRSEEAAPQVEKRKQKKLAFRGGWEE